MELSFLLLQQIISMALMVLMGYVLVKTRCLKSSDSHVLSALTVYVICPCMIISSFQIEYSAEKLHGLLAALGAAVIAQFCLILLGWLLKKPLHLSPVENGSFIYSNGGNLLVPLITSILGREYVLYTCAFSGSQNLLLWTHGVRMMGKGQSRSWKKILLTPNILAIFLGLILFVAGIELPSILGSTVETVGNTIGPVCMFLIGMFMADSRMKDVFGRARNYLVCFGRLIVSPLLFILGVRLSGITAGDAAIKEVLWVTMLALSAPVAVSVTQIVDLYATPEDARLASAINVMTVIFCMVTMPLMTMLYQAVC